MLRVIDEEGNRVDCQLRGKEAKEIGETYLHKYTKITVMGRMSSRGKSKYIYMKKYHIATEEEEEAEKARKRKKPQMQGDDE